MLCSGVKFETERVQSLSVLRVGRRIGRSTEEGEPKETRVRSRFCYVRLRSQCNEEFTASRGSVELVTKDNLIRLANPLPPVPKSWDSGNAPPLLPS